MKLLVRILVLVLFGIVVRSLPAIPQDLPQFKPEELDQLVAPIALHPDSLLAQILMASTYPLEVVQADRFVKDNAQLKGDQLSEELKKYSWDDSVKSLVFFPPVLTMMSEQLDWLQKLGDAFLAQQQDVLAAVQRLRARAQEAGHLTSTPEQTVIVEPIEVVGIPVPPIGLPPGSPPAGSAPGTPPPRVQHLPAQPPTGPRPTPLPQPPPTAAQTPAPPAQPPQVIRIEPANPQVISLPSYNPTVVYGAFPPAYPPYSPYPPGYFAAGAFTFFAGAAVGAALWGNCNWGGGDVDINNNKSNNFTRNVNNSNEARNRVEQRDRSAGSGGAGGRGQDRGKWQHSPEHRQGVQYRDKASQQRFNKSGPANAQSREAFRGRDGQGSDFSRAGGQGGFGQQSGRPQQGAIGGQQGGGVGPGGGQARQSDAFGGMSSGRDAQTFSNRGNSSRESFSRSTGGGGGSRAGGGGGGGGRSGGGGGGGRGGGRR